MNLITFGQSKFFLSFLIIQNTIVNTSKMLLGGDLNAFNSVRSDFLTDYNISIPYFIFSLS